MKSAAKVAVLLALLSVLAHAQPQPGFQHVIIVIQENRTPDNLFAGVPPQNGWAGSQWFEAGVDLAKAPQASQDKGSQPGQPWCLGACFDPGHENSGWQYQNSNGFPRQTKNPGGCVASGGLPTYCGSDQSGNRRPVCSFWDQTWEGCGQSSTNTLPAWPEESYVSYTLDMNAQGQHVLDPYVSVATQYGFGNYFYQTNQGPSQPAHHFLFGGTSAPYGNPSQQYYNWFAADNDHHVPTGCEAPVSDTRALINPDGNFGDTTYTEKDLNPCFDHQTMADLLKAAGLKWKYYTDSPNGIWTAPNGIQHICLKSTTSQGSICDNSDFTDNVVPSANFFRDDFHGGGTNITAPPPPGGPVYCNLPSVAWIIPDGTASDHPGFKNGSQTDSTAIEGGPNWVANIINAVGNATCVEPPNSPFHNQSPWNDTVIFVVWDDWGGWYDHVMGTSLYQDNFLENGVPPTCIPEYQPNGQLWGCGYTYGFRVPFLVVSAYTQSGTVSGACGAGELVSCGTNSNTYPHQHDFGSILAFIERNFSLTLGGINLANGFPFADYYAPELVAPGGPYPPLGDFFGQTWRGFAPIATVNNSFTFDYFYNFNGPFTDPDNDVIDND